MCFCASGMKKGNFYMIRLVASDIDGTLLQGGARALSDELFGLIRVLKKRGILFCAASGRQYRSMRALFAQAEDDIAYLCENGAIVYRGGSVVSKLAMERADALALIGQIPGAGAMRGAHLRRGHQLSAPQASGLCGPYPLFCGQSHYAGEAGAGHPGGYPQGVGLLPGWRGEPCTDAGRAVESGVQRGCGGEKWLDFTRADKGTALLPCAGSWVCARRRS